MPAAFKKMGSQQGFQTFYGLNLLKMLSQNKFKLKKKKSKINWKQNCFLDDLKVIKKISKKYH